jgi:hypothetical protein
MTWGEAPEAEPLTIANAGLTLTADARLTRFKPTLGTGWASGHFPWAVEWVCPDPLRYGVPTGFPTAFPTAGGGLRFPLFTNGTVGVGHLDFGLPGTSGRVTVSNPGTAAAWPQFTVVGPVPDEGFDVVCVETGERLTYATGVSAGSTVVMDSATGRVLLNGDADRSGFLTRADWFSVPPGGTCTVAFLPRGVSSAAVLTVTLRPAWW